jgi:LacI family transcriptional regulator
MTQRVTLAAVAAHAGVSRATASLVLRGTGRVSADTRQRVLASMTELGYVYDRVAASMRTQQTPVVGVMISDIANAFFAELFAGLEASLGTAGYLPLVAHTGKDLTRQDELLQVLREHRVSGLAIAPVAGTAPDFVDRLREWGIGHVLLTLPVDGATTSFVGPDDRRGGELAAAHLIEVHGCRRLLFLGGTRAAANSRDRLAGVRAAARAAGLPADAVTEQPARPGDPTGVALGKAVVERGELAEGVVCASDVTAMGLYRALRSSGPAQDVRITGYDDIPSAAVWEPPLTTVATHAVELGRRAARLLTERIAAPDAEPVLELVEPQLVVRRSCGCP